MRLLLLSRYGSLGASSRVRYLQYLPYFHEQGWTVEIHPLFSNVYVEALYTRRLRVLQVIRGYSTRLLTLFRARRFDVLIIEKELFPFLPPTFERLLSALDVPYVVDYDDALFHRYDLHPNTMVRSVLGKKIDSVMRYASLVVAGNEYLANRAFEAGAQRVELIPTVVDTERYKPALRQGNEQRVVGWIGTPTTSRYLRPLFPVFDLLQKEMDVRFIAVGARVEDFAGAPLEVWSWSQNSEVESIQQFDIGIMPLEDSPWERGKCGYKLIQYMACGLPVVCSPVGVNSEIVVPEENGMFAGTSDEWMCSLRRLLYADASSLYAMGLSGRNRVIKRYSLRSQAPYLVELIKSVVLAPGERGRGKGTAD